MKYFKYYYLFTRHWKRLKEMKSKITERVEQFRKRQEDRGIVRTEVYVHADDQAAVKAFARQLNEKREPPKEPVETGPTESVEERLKRQAEEARQKFRKAMK